MATVIIYNNPILKYRVLTVFDSSITHKYLSFANQNIRLIKWENGLELVSKSPIFGYGIGDAKSELIEQYKSNGFQTGVENAYNSHNQYIDILLQTGLFGLLIMFGLFYTIFSNKLKNRFELKLIAFVFVISFFTESILGRHWGIISFVLFISFVSKYKILYNENSPIGNTRCA
jgi:O-antigen ligase